MELTKEIKAKVFAQYLGQNTNMKLPNGDVAILKGWHIDRIGSYENFKIILKPLSEITDEDAIEVYDIIKDTEIIDEAKREKVLFWFENKTNGYLKNDWNLMLEVFQYLQRKGYDLPNYLLGGKTLYEAGLAIYE